MLPPIYPVRSHDLLTENNDNFVKAQAYDTEVCLFSIDPAAQTAQCG